MVCKETDNVDVPLAYIGLKILLVDQDAASLSNMTTILEGHSFKVTAIKQATVALSILRQHIDQFDLVMVDANMLEMNYLDFIKSTQLIKDKPIILMSEEVTMEIVLDAKAQGALRVWRKSSISSTKLKNVWQHVNWHKKEANVKLQYNKGNQVEVMENPSCAKKLQDRKGKGKANCSEIYQNQVAGSKRMRNTNEEARFKRCGTSENEITIEIPEKKRRHLRWTPHLDKKLDEVVRELGEKAPTRQILERMCVPDMTTKQLAYRLKKKKSQKQAPYVQVTASTNFNEGHPSEVLNASEFFTNFNELFQGAYIPQPPDVPLVASQRADIPQPPDVPLVASQRADIPQPTDVPLVASQRADIPQPTDVPLVASQRADIPQPTDVPLVASQRADIPQPTDVPLVASQRADIPQPPDVPLVASQRADIPQPPDVPLVASQSLNDYSNWWNEWAELLEFDDFELK